ncbi:family 43 glycosylhydrolase [Rathayibacter sp. AY1E2]|uniref:family 43 glycosylhydrolase n=1 Tax=Rathayibacter sp. AY1E2 TaxID=2080550 RepID=UPI000CE8E311|nr:RICIN domain-containing protein [Rathayibacter sp. AY1E2]PPH52961.1 alpha-L-arabinofuranosidase [Rathayibacter sp. AY1E2]
MTTAPTPADAERPRSAGLRRRLTAGLLILLAAVVALPFTAASPAVALGEPTFTNPIAPDTADPTIEFHDGNYYMVATTWDNRVVMRKAPTLAALGTTAPTTVYTDTNPGRNANMWAPELQRLQGPNGWRWYLMYTMGTVANFDGQHLQVIESAGDDPMGPYTYKGRPVPTDRWNIDGAYLELNGELFMTWSEFQPGNGLQSNYIARMSDPWTATSTGTVLSEPVEPWETIGMPVNEGPIPLQRDGRTWIVYSASFCGTEDYQLGTLEYDGTGDPVLASSWTKSDGPVFSKANGEYGTGHNDFFDSPDGTETWNLYHANPGPNDGCSRQRSARAHIVEWTATGEPDFGAPLGTAARIPVPSGENAPITARVEGAPWQLVSRSTGLCATVSSAQSGDGAGVVQGSCSTPRANWMLDATGEGTLRVMNASSGKALGPVGCATGTAGLQQSAWLTTSCQQWTVAPATGGYSTLTNRTSGKLLEASGPTVRQAAATSAAAQEWVLRPAGPVAVTSFVTGKSFDLPNCSTADGALLQQQDWLGSPCQRVTFGSAADGALEMHPVSAAAKCLAVTGGSTADGATVTQGACGVTGSSWRLRPGNDGTVELRAAHSGKALDLSNCSAQNGTRIGQWSVLNNDCQRFRVSLGAPASTVPLQPVATSAARCVAGKVVVTTVVRNADDLPVDVTIGTGTAAKRVTALAGGVSTSTAVTTRQASVPVGSTTVAVAGTDDAGRTATVTASHPALTCG